MNVPMDRAYRLALRGGSGLACDQDGVSLGPADLVRVRLDTAGARRCEVRPPSEIGRLLRTAYGPQPDEVVQRLHRGLRRAAAWIETGDLGRAGLEAVMLGFPDLTPPTMAKLASIADLEKGDAWRTEPRVPAGQTGGGQWTAGGGGASTVTAKPVSHRPSAARTYRRPTVPLLDDGVYRPGIDGPSLISTGGAEEDDERFGSNGPPADITSLAELFPGLKEEPGLAIPLSPIEGFLGIGRAADGTNLAATMMKYRFLLAKIRTLDPDFEDEELSSDGIAGLNWEDRNDLLDRLRMQLAASLYRHNGDDSLLQVETLRFLQRAVDDAYAEGVKEYNAGRLQPRLSRAEAIGNYIDTSVRSKLSMIFNMLKIPYGYGRNITVNNRDYDTSLPKNTYRIPDARVGSISFDWTLTFKTISSPQIRGFFSADTRPTAVVIVRPSHFGPNSTYIIPRPAALRSTR